MDFDLSKENIQPLRGGRNVSQLGIALQAQTDMDHQRELLQQKAEFEKLIRTYSGDDPLENWYNYISWVEQSYPKQGHEGNLVYILEHCLKLFENDSRYSEDRRLCKLFIKYFDQQQCPVELYHMMYAQGICKGCADMYKAWAYYYELAGDFQNAHRVFELGKRMLAQPYDELQAAHESLVLAAGRHVIHGPNELELSEKRQALTLLRTFKPGQVGSVRVANNATPGTLGSAAASSRFNSQFPVYEMDGDEEVRSIEAAPSSIVSAAKRQQVPKENTLKPGPWTTVPVKKKQAIHRTAPFTVHEDGEESSNSFKTNNFVTSTLENYSDWVVSLTIHEPKDDRMIPMYPKGKVYSDINIEYSLEELRALRYIKNETKPPISFVETSEAMSLTEFPDETKFEHMQASFSQNYEQHKNSFTSSNEHLGLKGIESQPPIQIWNESPVDSPIKSPQNLNPLHFNLWSFKNDEKTDSPNTSIKTAPKSNVPKFSIYEQSTLALQEHMEPRVSAMKTPFKDLNAEELAETGSRGGMDIAAAAPVDSAKRLPIYDDDSNSYERVGPENFGDVTCNTQTFAFNLNAMQVSTPENKQNFGMRSQAVPKVSPKQLFADNKTEDDKQKILSTIFEESKSYAQSSSSSSSNATTKSSPFCSNIKHTNMSTISEEHNSYLAQNLMANAALRSSLLGDFMDLNHSGHLPIVQTPTTQATIVESVPEPTKVVPLEYVPSDPFKQKLIETLLERINFPGPHTQGFYWISFIPKLQVRKESTVIGTDRYIIEKQLGKGTYGTVFRGIDVKSGNTVAVKFQKPANKWEFYICRELRSRLANHPLRNRFMDVRIGYFCQVASVLISEFMPCGSLLDVANMVKQKSGRSMKESLCIHFCLEMLRVVQAMHEVKIIHADIKPDNFLVQLFPNDVIGLQLIDFGCSIDMSLFPPGASFTRRVTTEDFVCCEMLDNRPWNYHTDLFCVAATAHVLLFEKYIQLQKRDGVWSISNRLPRYARLDLWNMFFSTLLNQQSGPADSAALQAMLEDSLNHKFDDYHSELRVLTNILKNR